MRPALIPGLLLAPVIVLAAQVWTELQFSVSRVEVPIASEGAVDGRSIRVAVIGDLHVGSGVMDPEALQRLFDAVVAEEPDLVLFVGDYASGVKTIFRKNIDPLRSAVVDRISAVAVHIPTYAVLGNHDNRTGAQAWLEAFRQAGINALDNEVIVTTVGDAPVCVRGLGDYYSGRFRWVDWPDSCLGRIRVTLTHDPAGAFVRPVAGVTFAGHTHCGQVRLPLLGALWMPTTAPGEAACGLYRDSERTLYVTAGVGTSVLPLRFGAPSAWDMVTLVATPGNRQ